MFVLSSPSGAGKTTLSRLLIERMPGLTLSVSATTRPMRPGEVEGSDYLFVDQARFEAMVKRDELLEWATVFDNRYGTPRAPVEHALSAGTDVLFDIDWQGTQQLREKARADVVSVFILPPSAADLEKRLHTRAQDSDAVIRGRMSRATHELSHWAEYDYIVINHDIEDAFAEVQSILKAERLKRERRTGLTTFVRDVAAAARPVARRQAAASFESFESNCTISSGMTASCPRARDRLAAPGLASPTAAIELLRRHRLHPRAHAGRGRSPAGRFASRRQT